METKISDQFYGLTDSFMAYLPNLVGGIILILIGWLLGWVTKRILVQLMVILRIDRLIKQSRWEVDFTKADVRYSLYNLVGNLGFIIVFLIFVTDALTYLKFKMLSDLLGEGIRYLPKVIVAAVIFIVGWMLASWVQQSIMKALHREEVPRASLIARFTKTMLIIFFFTVALVELNVAREIVIIGFATIFITLGAIAVVLTAVGGRNFLQKIGDSIKEGREKDKA